MNILDIKANFIYQVSYLKIINCAAKPMGDKPD